MSHAKPKIFVTRPFPGPGLKALTERYDVTLNKSTKSLSSWQLKRAVKGMDAVVCLLTDPIDSKIMDAAGPQLKLIANYAVGFDNIDLKAAADRNIIVTNTPGVLTEAVAEHTFALILAVGRRVLEGDFFVRHHKYKQWDPELLLGTQLAGKTLGIIGLGRIGVQAATIAQGFGMSTIYFDEIRHKDIEHKHKLEYHEFETVLKQSDVISLHVPLLPSTKHMIDKPQLQIMKPTAILINTARGPVVNEHALVEALTKNQIMGAGLDVFEHEPKVSKRLERLPNVVLTPHIASATHEARDMMGEIVAKNVISVFTTGKAVNPAQ